MDAQALSLSPTSGLLTLVISALGIAVPVKLPAAFLLGTARVILPARPRSAETA